MFNDYLADIKSGKNLDRSSASDLLGLILDNDEITESQTSEFLTATTSHRLSTDEILGFIDAMRGRMNKLDLAVDAIDTCGTGGDKSGSFNISTASSIVAAASGVPVAKHGNRSASSKCGSADVLEALKIPINSEPNASAANISSKNFAFLFAQQYHPALKKLAIVRKQLGFPTVFNLLGPLLNPAQVKRQVIGTFNEQNAELLAEVVSQLENDHVIVLNSRDGLDEASLSAPTKVREIKDGSVNTYDIKSQDFNLESASKDDLLGGDAVKNAQILTEALSSSNELTAHQRAVALNAGIALFVADKSPSIGDGVKLAAETIKSGLAKSKLKELQQ